MIKKIRTSRLSINNYLSFDVWPDVAQVLNIRVKGLSYLNGRPRLLHWADEMISDDCSLSLSVTHSLTLSLTHTLTLSLSLSLSHTHALSHSHTQPPQELEERVEELYIEKDRIGYPLQRESSLLTTYWSESSLSS